MYKFFTGINIVILKLISFIFGRRGNENKLDLLLLLSLFGKDEDKDFLLIGKDNSQGCSQKVYYYTLWQTEGHL